MFLDGFKNCRNKIEKGNLLKSPSENLHNFILMTISKKKIGIFHGTVVARYFLLTIRNCSQFRFFYSSVAVYLLHLNLSISLIKSCFNKLLTDRS